jgi:hypothetical protein
MHYAGIGSRNTPNIILNSMRLLATKLETFGYMLRSGGAVGADSAFESGIINPLNKEIFYADDATDSAIKYASNFHPAWYKCTDYVRNLHGRNSMILLGKNLDEPVKFVICYTENGKDVGGTGLGIRIAQNQHIPVFNLFFEESIQQINCFIGENDLL